MSSRIRSSYVERDHRGNLRTVIPRTSPTSGRSSVAAVRGDRGTDDDGCSEDPDANPFLPVHEQDPRDADVFEPMMTTALPHDLDALRVALSRAEEQIWQLHRRETSWRTRADDRAREIQRLRTRLAEETRRADRAEERARLTRRLSVGGQQPERGVLPRSNSTTARPWGSTAIGGSSGLESGLARLHLDRADLEREVAEELERLRDEGRRWRDECARRGGEIEALRRRCGERDAAIRLGEERLVHKSERIVDLKMRLRRLGYVVE